MIESFRSFGDDSAPLVSVRQLHKAYVHERKAIPVLMGLDLVIERGDLISITGASGVGKTTLLQILGTLDVPTSGQIHYEGINPFALGDRQRAIFRRRNVGFVFQFHHLLPQFSAVENVAMPAWIDGVHPNDAAGRATELLVRIGLEHRLDHRPTELSGGEQQRVAVARALMMSPKVLLADEPTGNLDFETGEGIHHLLVELNRELGIAMVIVTHNPALADRLPIRLHLSSSGLHPVDAKAASHVSPDPGGVRSASPIEVEA